MFNMKNKLTLHKINGNLIEVGETIDKDDFVGLVVMWASSTVPDGWLSCDGQAVSRTTYAVLFSIIGTLWGSGDGSTTFNLPDLRSRFPLGYSASAPTKIFTFSSRSSNTITVTGSSNSAHNEIQTGQAVLYSAPSGAMTGLTHNTTYYLIRVAYNQFSLATSIADANAGVAISLSSDGTGTQTFTLSITARSIGETGGEETHSLTDSEAPSHDHGYSSVSGIQSVKINDSAGGGAAGGGSNDGSWSFQSNGSDSPHNNMPPFAVMNFIIKT